MEDTLSLKSLLLWNQSDNTRRLVLIWLIDSRKSAEWHCWNLLHYERCKGKVHWQRNAGQTTTTKQSYHMSSQQNALNFFAAPEFICVSKVRQKSISVMIWPPKSTYFCSGFFVLFIGFFRPVYGYGFGVYGYLRPLFGYLRPFMAFYGRFAQNNINTSCFNVWSGFDTYVYSIFG